MSSIIGKSSSKSSSCIGFFDSFLSDAVLFAAFFSVFFFGVSSSNFKNERSSPSSEIARLSRSILERSISSICELSFCELSYFSGGDSA